MNTDSRELQPRPSKEELAQMLREGRDDDFVAAAKLQPVPKRFDDEAAAMLERGRVPSPAFSKWADGAQRAARKRRRKIAQRSKRRNRR